ncbi:hypothetical protein K0M31_001977 [Melipona bicolor]|uniref:Uncharacterized protein n=1 Tax=Melipona bicolor TaxID=60889 RepID=A0AA40GGP9_9HYME|nr:hypothetical protein K0M31_001977 [Melipona bicolor]
MIRIYDYRKKRLQVVSIHLQCNNATAISMQESADSTWNYTSCPDVSVEAFVCSAGILRQEDTVTIVEKVTIGIRRDRSNIVRPANVSTVRQSLITANLE